MVPIAVATEILTTCQKIIGAQLLTGIYLYCVGQLSGTIGFIQFFLYKDNHSVSIMKVGIALPNIGPQATSENLIQLTTQAEEGGFDSLWTITRILWLFYFPPYKQLLDTNSNQIFLCSLFLITTGFLKRYESLITTSE